MNELLYKAEVEGLKVLVKELEQDKKILEEKNQRLLDKLSNKGVRDYVEYIEKGKNLEAYLEAMAAAYFKTTNLVPNDCVLVMGIPETGKEVFYWFEQKNERHQKIEEREI